MPRVEMLFSRLDCRHFQLVSNLKSVQELYVPQDSPAPTRSTTKAMFCFIRFVCILRLVLVG